MEGATRRGSDADLDFMKYSNIVTTST